MLAESRRQARASLDSALDIHHQAGEAGVLVSARDDLEGLQQRNAGLQHRRQLSGEERDVFFIDAAAAAEGLPAELRDADPLAPQVGVDHRFRRGLCLASNVAVIAVDTLPEVRALLDFGTPA